MVPTLAQIESRADQMSNHSVGFWYGLLGGLIALDQISKWFFIDFLNWPVFLNENFAFSLPVPSWLMYVIYAIVFWLILKYLYTQWPQLPGAIRAGFVLILSGGVSNVAERIFLGSVRDFIFIGNGVLNFADIFILAGMLLVFVSSLTNPKKAS